MITYHLPQVKVLTMRILFPSILVFSAAQAASAGTPKEEDPNMALKQLQRTDHDAEIFLHSGESTGWCLHHSMCDTGWCKWGKCAEKLLPGTPCGANVECTTDHCTSTGTCSSVYTREQLAEEYPGITEITGGPPQNKKILCAFHRMLERAGKYPSDDPSEVIVSKDQILDAIGEYGVSGFRAQGALLAVAFGQLFTGAASFGEVNLAALHRAPPVSHDCGLAFPLGWGEVDDDHIEATLSSLNDLADADGNITFDDLMEVKTSICEEQGVRMSNAGEVEVNAIFTFLGGQKNHYIAVSDVERFLKATLPEVIGVPGTYEPPGAVSAF